MVSEYLSLILLIIIYSHGVMKIERDNFEWRLKYLFFFFKL